MVKEKMSKLEKEINLIDLSYLKNRLDYTIDIKKNQLVANYGYATPVGNLAVQHNSFLNILWPATLDYIAEKYDSAIQTMSSNLQKESAKPSYEDFYLLNNIACAHSALSKLSLGVYYFKKCISLSQKLLTVTKASEESKSNTIHRINTSKRVSESIFNLGLTFYKIGNWDSCIDTLVKITSSQSHNKMYWYRLGIAYFNSVHELLKSKNYTAKHDLYTHVKRRESSGK
jgi:tetratricopeptide (TPR) repeat protein